MTSVTTTPSSTAMERDARSVTARHKRVAPGEIAIGVELFATRIRFSGFSVGYNVCVAVFGGTTPYVVTWLTAASGKAIAPAFYLVAAAVVSLATVLTLRESAGRALAQVQERPANVGSGIHEGEMRR